VVGVPFGFSSLPRSKPDRREIVIEGDHLTVQRPGRDELTIDGGNNGRTFDSWSGYGYDARPSVLAINDVTLKNGSVFGLSVGGGCIFGVAQNPNAIIALTRSTVSNVTSDMSTPS
jgi:hypothetical protein